MRFSQNTIIKRKPLWAALSDLFLDTELQEFQLEYIAKIMKQSGYSVDKIHTILMHEVFPVCIANLHSIAGEWAGFDEDWLVETIVAAKPPNRLRRWMNHRSFWMIEKDWNHIVKKFNDISINLNR